MDAISQPGSVDWSQWSVLDTVEGGYPPSTVTLDQFSRPLYPVTSEPVNGRECVQGWIVSPVSDGATIDLGRYTPVGLETAI